MEREKLKEISYFVILFLSVAVTLSISADFRSGNDTCHSYGLAEGETCYITWDIQGFDTGIALYIDHDISRFHRSELLTWKDIFDMETDLRNRD